MSSERQRARLSPTARGPRTRNFLHLDPPDHTRIRRLVTKAFTPRMVASLEPRVRHIVDELLDRAAAAGRLEVVDDLAYPLPLRVIFELLGVDYADHALLQSWSARLSEALEPPLPGLVAQTATAQAARARAEFVGYFRDLIAQRRAHPRPDLVSQLVQVRDGGDQLSESELLATCVLLVNAGHETTVNLVTNGVLALLRHPGQLRLLRERPPLAGQAVEEVLRYDAPVQLTSRVATRDGDLGGVPVAAGDMVLVLLAAANRDPRRFPDPDRFDVTRADASHHLTFAAGTHFCPGAGLARLEVRVAFEQLAARLVNPRLDPAGPTYKPNLSLRGPARLDVGFDRVSEPARAG